MLILKAPLLRLKIQSSSTAARDFHPRMHQLSNDDRLRETEPTSGFLNR